MKFSKETIDKLNAQQVSRKVHPYTCDARNGNGDRSKCPNDGILIATEDGWVCPCGKYKQDYSIISKKINR